MAGIKESVDKIQSAVSTALAESVYTDLGGHIPLVVTDIAAARALSGSLLELRDGSYATIPHPRSDADAIFTPAEDDAPAALKVVDLPLNFDTARFESQEWFVNKAAKIVTKPVLSQEGWPNPVAQASTSRGLRLDSAVLNPFPAPLSWRITGRNGRCYDAVVSTS